MDHHLRDDAEIAVCMDKPYVHQERVTNSNACLSDSNGLHHTIPTRVVHVLRGTWHSVHTYTLASLFENSTACAVQNLHSKCLAI
jgi:hypothetical protein